MPLEMVTMLGRTSTLTGPPAAVAAAAGIGAAVGGATLMETWVDHQPLAGVCAYTVRVWGPVASTPGPRVSAKPEFVQNGLASACATSGRGCANVAWPTNMPPCPANPS